MQGKSGKSFVNFESSAGVQTSFCEVYKLVSVRFTTICKRYDKV
jgi:hypothetical protein